MAQSTSEAELYALVEAVNELNVLRNFLIEIGEGQRTSKRYEDSKGVLDWANNKRSNSECNCRVGEYYNIILTKTRWSLAYHSLQTV